MTNIKIFLKKAKEIMSDPEIGLPESLQSPLLLIEIFKILIKEEIKPNIADKSIETFIKPQSSAVISRDDFFKNLEAKTKIEIAKLEKIYDYSNNKVSLIFVPIPGETNSEQEKNAARFILLAYRIGLKQELLNASLLRKLLKDAGYGGTNFSSNVRSLRPEVISEGNSNQNAYKLTVPGEQKAIELIQKIVSEANL